MNPNKIIENLNENRPVEGSSSNEPPGDSVTIERDSSDNNSSLAQPPAIQNSLKYSNIIAALESGVEAFFTCTGCIFHIYDQPEAQEMLVVVRECLRDAGDMWPQLIFRGSAPTQLTTPLCSVCIMAAIGLQYTKDPIPAMGFQPSEENGTYQYVNIFYEITKHLVEAVIENNVLEAIKVCAAMCVFNTISHATVALANAGTSSLHNSLAGIF